MFSADGSPRTPKPTDTICSDHFIGGKKSAEEASPSYIPTIFPSVYKKSKINENAALNRYLLSATIFFLILKKNKFDKVTFKHVLIGMHVL